MKKKILRTILVVLLLALIVATVIYFSSHSKLDWTLYGNYISQDGEMGDFIQLTLRCRPNSNTLEEKTFTTKFDIQWPENFVFLNWEQKEYTCYTFPASGTYPARCIVHGFVYYTDPIKQGATTNILRIEIFPEEEFAVFTCPHWNGQYIVASTNPNANIAALFEMYKTAFLSQPTTDIAVSSSLPTVKFDVEGNNFGNVTFNMSSNATTEELIEYFSSF